MKSAMMAKGQDKNVVSGNSRVKVTVNGQVNRAIRLSSSGGETQIQSVDNDGSSSRLIIHAVGKANPNLTIGAHHSLEWQENRRSFTSNRNEGNDRLRSRNVELWVAHKDFGTLHMGKGSIAADAADLLSKSGVGYVFGSAGFAADGFFAGGIWASRTVEGKTSVTNRGWRNFAFFGARENRIMYTTPNLMGGSLAVSYGQNKSFSAAVNYAGAPPGVKGFSILFKAGYRTDPNEHDDGAMAPDAFVDTSTGATTAPALVYTKGGGKASNDPRRTAWGVSGGVEHVPSGFSISGGYGAQRMQGMAARPNNWYADIGWKGKVSDIGTTALGIGYFTSTDGNHLNAQQYWVAINQDIAAAAADVYAGIAFDTGEAPWSNTNYRMNADGPHITNDATGNPNALGVNDPCYTGDAASFSDAAADNAETCAVDRDGVFVFIAGVRLKF